MPNFWSYITNDKYAVGCTGQTVYVYDALGNEIARFKDLTYAYKAMFCPEHDTFVVKTTEGRLAVYSLNRMKLIKKFRFSKIDAGQDDGFCFSSDGKYFYNIERHIDGYNSCLSVYETSKFNKVKQLFLSDSAIVLEYIEYDDALGGLFVLGFMRGESGVIDYGFAAALNGDDLANITRLADDQYYYVLGYKSLEIMGFTLLAKECSSLPYDGYDLENIEHIKLCDLICRK
ncbi:MAG: hypothetical protein FWE06_09470 [Oscillospiraceae bacterium]|nr:hypothetical protein [Oscillospiraceae bacterium]